MPESMSAVDALADRFWESYLQLNPISATVYGDTRYDDRLPDPGPDGRARGRRLAEETRAAALAIPLDGLGVEERITRDILIVVGEMALEDDDQRLDTLLVVDQMGGPQTLLPQLCQFQAADDADRLERFIARLHAYPAYMAANRELLREALASGLTAPRIVAQRTIAQLERMLAIPTEEAIVAQMARCASDADRERIRQVVRDEVYPADAAFLESLKGDYLAATREDPGIWSAPNGDEIYHAQIRHWTTLDLDPLEVHRVGLEELEAIDAERRVIARAAGHGDDVDGYRAALAADPANRPLTRGDLVARAEEDIERANAAAPRVFRRLPKAGCRVLPVEEFKEKDSPFAYYFPPSEDGGR